MTRLLPLAALILSACITDTQIARTDDPDTLTAQERLDLTDAEVAAILAFLNDCETDLGVLDDDVPLDADAAEQLIDHRNGADRDCGTADDDRFDDLDEVDAVPQVGDASILAILAWLTSGDPVDDGEWEGVYFTEQEIAVVLEIANQASLEVLDIDVDLASNAAENIVAQRPHDTMDHLAETPQVGPSALEKLKAFVPSWAG